MSNLLGNVKRFDITFERGEGMWLYDSQGRPYLDFLSGVAVCSLGHSHPVLTEALGAQAGRLMHTSNLFYTAQIVEAADALVGKLGPGRVYFCNSGTEANEAAIKAARKHAWREGETLRNEIVCLEGSFHGRTYGALAATMQPAKWEGFAPLPEGFRSVGLNDVKDLEAAVSDRTAAILLEPIQGEGGIRPLSEEFARAAARLASERGAILVCDEIQTGVGRTGRWWGYEHLGIQPQIVTLAKALGGGFPVGATWLSEELAGSLQPGDHSTTQGGGPLACAAVLTTLQVVEAEGLVGRAAEMGKRLTEEIRALGTEVRGEGLLLGLELDAPKAAAVVHEALERGLIVNDVTPTTIRLAPPLIVNEEEIAEAAVRLTEAVRAT